MSHVKNVGRRSTLRIGGGLAATFLLTPQHWRKPVVDTILLPAHAQSSPPTTTLMSIVVVSIGVETRTPSGGSPTPSVATITLGDCDNLAGATLTAAASVTLNPAGTLDLGSGGATLDPVSGNVIYSVPTNIVADIAAINTLTIAVTADGVTQTDTVSGSALAALLSGSTAATSCP